MKKAKGFSLIELSVVLLLITLIASVAVRETSELGFQTRYEQTKERLELIRQAILGNPRQIINGQQAISGFVADMGRLPVNLRELLDQSYCAVDRTIDETTSADPAAACNALVAGAWQVLPNWQPDPLTGLKYGWQGPYLTISGEVTGTDAITDGWGRETQGFCATSLTTDLMNCPDAGAADWRQPVVDHNYGWYFNPLIANSLTLLSYGKDHVFGGADYDADYPAFANQPAITSQDWLVDISGGIQAYFKVANTPVCNFDTNPIFNNLRSCRNASGRWHESGCHINENACSSINAINPTTTNATNITIWNAQANHCEIAVGDCTGAGFTWDSGSSSCHLAKTACDALTTPGTWTGAAACRIEGAHCEVLAGAGQWNGTNGECEFSSVTCSSAGGVWDTTTQHCDITPSQCLVNAGTWGCNISQKICNIAGGAWNRCDFTPAQCNNMTGGSYNSQCAFTDSICTRAGGTWQANSRACQFNAASCGNLGGVWDVGASSCAFNPSTCSNAAAHWDSYCEFDTQAHCQAQGGIWNTGTTPYQCEFTDTQCRVNGGTPREGDCSIPRAEHDGAPFNKQTCETAMGIWNEHRQLVCLNVFYRNNGNLNVATSLPTFIEEDGAYQTVQFNFAANPVVLIPIGQNAIGIYEYDGDCNLDNPLYPAGRQAPIQVDFHPRATLPVINW